MRRVYTSLAVALFLAPAIAVAQDANRTVANGGVKVAGWTGVADGGADIGGASLVSMGKDLHVKTGPAVTYWNPANKASGDYTVKATFTEAKYMELNDHPHPYGIMFGGNDLGTADASYLYCAANGNGSFIVRGFGPKPFQVNGRSGVVNAAIHKAAAKGESVTNEVAVSVKGDKVTCSINGTEVGSYNKADLVAAGKLKSTDGVYGLRFAHNTEGHVAGLTMTKP
jgi:hypothetical protein